MEMIHLQATPQRNEAEGRVTARLVPFGETIDHHGREVEFARGSIDFTGHVPVNIDHDGSVASQVGVATRFQEADDGLYAELQLSDTTLGRDVRTLLMDGVVTDVSVGIYRTESGSTLDHIALVDRGAFGQATAPSKVLSIHSAERRENQPVDEMNEAPSVEQYDDTEVRDELTALRESVAALNLPGAVNEPEPLLFQRMRDHIAEGGGILELDLYALAGDTTTGAAGLVPDWQSTEIISIIAEGRPYIESIPRDPIGDYGMTVDYPTVTQKPDVGVQATENTEVATQSFTVGTTSIDLLTFAGANLASRQVVERSRPSYVEAFFREMAGLYADATEASATADAVANAGDTAILADLGADAAATFAAVAAATSAIATGVRRPATHMALASDRWAQMQALADTDGRPLLVYPPNGPSNAQGQSSFAVDEAQYHGLTVLHSPAAATGTCLIYAAPRSGAWLEQAPVQLRAEVVSTLSWELGIYGLGAHAAKYAAGFATLTLI